MTKRELIETMATEANISKAAAGRALEGFLGSITETLAQGEQISLIGFGRFYTSRRKARACSNPQMGERMVIPARTVARFKPGKQLAEAVK